MARDVSPLQRLNYSNVLRRYPGRLQVESCCGLKLKSRAPALTDSSELQPFHPCLRAPRDAKVPRVNSLHAN